MKVTFMGRFEFVHLIRTQNVDNCALISINDSTTENNEMKVHIELETNNRNHICLAFQDVDHHDGTGISNRQAKKLFDFIKENEGKDFIVHCFAGVSRSAAVAKFINDYYDVQDLVLENYKIYNKLVYSKLNGQCGQMSLEDYYRQLEEEDRHA